MQDLRLVLQSSDRELAAAKKDLEAGRSEQEREAIQMSSSLISTQLQFDKITYVCSEYPRLHGRECV